MPFGQLVIGAPGAGKSFYCTQMSKHMNQLKRPVYVVNLDPANDEYSESEEQFPLLANVCELISSVDVMRLLSLGPNGALLYCLEFLEKNIDWLRDALAPVREEQHSAVVLFDCPGQIELFTHHQSFVAIAHSLQKWGFRLMCVHLVDIRLCGELSSFVSGSVMALSTMLHFELPHVNLLTKVDLLSRYGDLKWDLRSFVETNDWQELARALREQSRATVAAATVPAPPASRFSLLSSRLCECLDDFGLVGYALLNAKDSASVHRVMRLCDKAIGYEFGGLSTKDEALYRLAAAEPPIEQLVHLSNENALDTSQYYEEEDEAEERDDDGAGRLKATELGKAEKASPSIGGADEKSHLRHRRCAHCRNVLEKPLRCAKCKAVFYCTKAHQIVDWKRHKTECVELKK